MTAVYITDHIKDPIVERGILGNEVSSEFDQNAEILIVWNDTITPEYMDQFKQLKSIIRCGVGYDKIDLEYAKSKNILVSNVPDYCTNEVADTAVAFILNIIRGVARLDFISKLTPNKWQDSLITDIRRTSSHVVGIVGSGRIGSNAMKKLVAMGITCLYYDPYLSEDDAAQLPGTRCSVLEDLLNHSTIVSIHVPLSDETHGMIDEKFLQNMKKKSSLVNTARGNIIKDLDLIHKYLKSDHLSNVAFDVLPEEPPRETITIQAWQAQEHWLDGRLIINPHTSFYSEEAYEEVRVKAAQNAKRILEKKEQINVVNL